MINRDKVGHLDVIAREPATQETPLNPGKTVPLTGVDKILLSDSTEWYQCVATDDCGETFEKALSARAHLVKHSAKIAVKRANAAKKARGNTTQVRAAATRTARQEAVKGENGTAFLAELADTLDRAVPLLRRLAAARVVPAVDDAELAQLREKAEKWDQAQSLFGGAGRR